MHYPALSIDTAQSLLRAAGVDVPAESLALERRQRRWMLSWPDSAHLAWLPADTTAATQLANENRMLELVAQHCSFEAPRVRHVEPAGLVIRTRVQGRVDPGALYAHIRGEPAFAAQLGEWLGGVIAQLHAIPAESVAGWLPTRPDWPGPKRWIQERLPQVLGAGHPLLPRLNALLQHYDALLNSPRDPVPSHVDLGLHNLVTHADSFAPIGVIDFEAAACVDRHVEFRYCPLGVDDETYLDHAMNSYCAKTGRSLDRRTVYLHNALSACCYIAYRLGKNAEERWCGRTLAEDVAWNDAALRRVGL